MMHKMSLLAYAPVGLLALMLLSSCGTGRESQAEASGATKKANQAVRRYLPFEDKSDFDNARKGFIATLDSGEIKKADGKTVYSMKQFDFLKEEAPQTVNPSLWRQSQLNAMNGLYKVVDGIYQVRGFDLANTSFVKGQKGWIVIDTLTANETAKAAYDLLQQHVEKAPITAVIITHSHVDHFGGIKGLISQEQIDSGQVKVVGPKNMLEEAVSENLIAGNQMSRRASYMYGNLLPKSATGTLGSGLGTTTAEGTVSIVKPTIDVSSDKPKKVTLDGVDFLFYYTPEAEAPSELMAYIPQYKALLQSEEINHTMHNLYTLRGAKTRNGLKWSKYIHNTIEWFGKDVEVSFGSHHWPTWGNAEILSFWKKQRDIYRYIHDEALRLANHGYTLLEIGDRVKLPDSLAKTFSDRGYYGSVNHNAKAQYNLYFGFFTGNPADLDPLPPAEAGKKFVEYMGGAKNVLKKAQSDFDKGEYRWAATALNYVVFADPNNKDARNLLAKTYEQMGFQAESGPWRNFYLSGALELREGVKRTDILETGSPDIIRNLDLPTLFDYLAVRLNGPKAAGKVMTFNLDFPDTGEKVTLYIENGVMNYTMGKQADKADTSISLKRAVLDRISLGQTTPAKAVDQGEITVSGDSAKFNEFISLLDTFDFWFNIVEP